MATIRIALLTFAIVIFSCNDKAKDRATSEMLSENGVETIVAAEQKGAVKDVTVPQLKYFYERDNSNGLTIVRYPFPADWQQHDSGEFKYTGPNGIKVYGEGGKSFVFSNDPTNVQLYQMTGMNVKYPLTMNEVIDEFFMPTANNLNRELVKKFPIPQIMQFYKNFDAMLFKVDSQPKQFEATAIEWVDPDGTRWITVLNYQIEQTPNQVFWGFQAGAVGAPAKYFEQAKQDYLNGLLNRQINPEWVRAVNQKTEFAIRRSNEAHNLRQAEFKRGVEQRQRQWEQRQQDITQNQKNWEANQESISRRNEMIADGILGRTNIIDPESGTKTKIDHTSSRYWVNTSGEYVGTNTTYDDPNKNAWMNNETWREYKIDDYK